MSERCRFSASDDAATSACEEAVAAGLSPLRVVIAGYLALAGEHPGVLLSPLALLLHGLGASRAFDGRLRQPGMGAKRPRGFVEGEAIPGSAYVAAPQAVPALFVALSYDSNRRTSELFKHALLNAKRAGAQQRHQVLSRVRDLGARAFAAAELHRPLIHVGGVTEGGVLGVKDFEPVPSIDVPTARQSVQSPGPLGMSEGVEVRFPWADGATTTPGCVAGYLAAVDRRGMGVLLRYDNATDGVEIDELELLAPRAAAPVRRGERRLRPGEVLPFVAPGHLIARSDGAVAEIRPQPSGLDALVAPVR